MKRIESRIHFGNFVRFSWPRAGIKTAQELADRVDVNQRTIMRWQNLAKPDGIPPGNLVALATALRMTVDEFDHAWRTTPVPAPPRKPRPEYKTLRIPYKTYDLIKESASAHKMDVITWIAKRSIEKSIKITRQDASGASEESHNAQSQKQPA